MNNISFNGTGQGSQETVAATDRSADMHVWSTQSIDQRQQISTRRDRLESLAKKVAGRYASDNNVSEPAER